MIAGLRVSDPTLKPRRGSEFAYRLVIMTLRLSETPEVVQAWLMGVNPEFGDRTAIRMLREDSRSIVGSSLLHVARAFASGG